MIQERHVPLDHVLEGRVRLQEGQKVLVTTRIRPSSDRGGRQFDRRELGGSLSLYFGMYGDQMRDLNARGVLAVQAESDTGYVGHAGLDDLTSPQHKVLWDSGNADPRRMPGAPLSDRYIFIERVAPEPAYQRAA